MDVNKDGVLQKAEIVNALQSTVSGSLITKLIELSDLDKNGVIDPLEFVQLVKLLKASKIDIRDKIVVTEK